MTATTPRHILTETECAAWLAGYREVLRFDRSKLRRVLEAIAERAVRTGELAADDAGRAFAARERVERNGRKGVRD